MIISGLNEYLMPVNSPIENNLKNGPQSPYVFDYPMIGDNKETKWDQPQ